MSVGCDIWSFMPLVYIPVKMNHFTEILVEKNVFKGWYKSGECMKQVSTYEQIAFLFLPRMIFINS